jgi:hypothetical protein
MTTHHPTTPTTLTTHHHRYHYHDLQDLVFHATANTADTDQLLLMTEQNNNDVMTDAKVRVLV